MFRKTKICATIGPSCEEMSVLVNMVKAGMNIARLNFSHGTYENHEMLIKNLREVEKETGEPIGIMQDLQGPKIRLGILPGAGVPIKEGDIVSLNTSVVTYSGNDIPLDYPDLHRFLKVGERILIDDGHVEFKILSIEGTKISCEVVEGALLFSNKGLNFPDSKLEISAMSEKDKKDLRFGVKMGVDIIALSFVRSAKDLIDLRFFIKQAEEELGIYNELPIQLVAKIERHEAVENLEEILDAADGIMVARGDLGLEMPPAEVPLVQKKIIDASNAAAKPVIVATQMLDSMKAARRPTRAEVSDVANAVIDHADALLLTNETASGKYPVLTIQMMAEIISTTERSTYDDMHMSLTKSKTNKSVDTTVSMLSRFMAEEVGAKLILAASLSGETGRLISRVRPSLPILVGTSTDRAMRQLNLSWGIKPFILEPCKSIEELVERSISYIKKNKIAKAGDKMTVVAGEPVGQAGNVNLVEVREIK